MRLLVSRPEPDAAETAAQLRNLGHETIVQPLLNVVFAPPPKDLARPGAIIFTSRNAVRAVERWPMAAAWHDLPVFAVGMETAAAARAVGFARVQVGMGNARQLGDLIESEMDRDGEPILYPAPRHRAGDLIERLLAMGFAIEHIEAYRSEPAAALDAAVAATVKAGALDGALFFSRRTAATFCDLVRAAGLVEALDSTAFFALSQAVAEPLRALGRGTVRVAGQPDAASLLALLSRDD
jgi:uroporphyrinogen-III synthase